MVAKRKRYKAPKSYRGYFKFPLVGAEDKVSFWQSAEFAGDFANPNRRVQIFKRLRNFRMEIHLKTPDGYLVTELSTPDTKLSKDELTQLLKMYGNQALLEVDDGQEINLTQSFFKIIL